MTMLRKIAEIKVAWSRISSYLGIINFLLILGIWLDRHYSGYVLIGYLLAFIFTMILVVVDRFFIWPYEQQINEKIGVMRMTECFRSAKHVTDLEKEGMDTRLLVEELKVIFGQLNMDKDFMRFLENLRWK